MLVMTSAHLMMVAMSLIVMVMVVLSVRTLEIATIVLVPRLHLEVSLGTWNMVLVNHLAITLRWMVG